MPKDSPALTLPQHERGASHLPAEDGSAIPQLNTLAAAGCHKLKGGIDELCDEADQAGFAFFEADLKGIKGKKNLLVALANATGFPDEFDANWDALVDVLCDLSWDAAPGYVLLLRNVSPTLGLSSNDREIAQDILDDTVVYWRQRNKPFWIFFAQP
jgi:hypothetical protein